MDGSVSVPPDIPEDHPVCFGGRAAAWGHHHLRGWSVRPLPYPYVRKALDCFAGFAVALGTVFSLTANPPADIGHVDFLEMVYKQAERPYVIVGLHFDQVSRG